MPDLTMLVQFAVFVLELFAVVFGALFLVLLFAEIAEQWRERMEK